MNQNNIPNRCRIVLIVPPTVALERLAAALQGGDVASVILPQEGLDEDAFQAFAEQATPLAQQAGAAVIIAGDTRIAGRVQADGIHVEGNRADLAEAIDKFQSKIMVGAGGAKTRDDALELGEARPDYMFFGRFGYDTKPEAHSRNLSLGQWWAEMIEVPCIVMAGSTLDSVASVAETGAEFVAVSAVVFAEGTDPRESIAAINTLLDETPVNIEG